MCESLRKLRGERLPGLGVSTALVARDDPALRVDHEDVRLVGRPEAPRKGAVGIGDRRPRPLVPFDEVAAFVRRVRDIEAEKGELSVIALELGVGDRLALARASPRRPDVHEDLPTAKVGEGGLLAVEGRSRDRRRLRARGVLGRSGLRGRGDRGCYVITGASPAAHGEERTQGHEKRERPHRVRVATDEDSWTAVQDFVRGS